MATVKVTHTKKMQFLGIAENGLTTIMDSSPDYGGENAGISPMDMLLISVGGCTGMDVVDILRKKRQEVTSYEINVSGERAEDYPRVFTQIRIEHIIRGRNVLPAAVKRAIDLSSDKYCSIIAMLKQVVDLEVTYRIEELE